MGGIDMIAGENSIKRFFLLVLSIIVSVFIYNLTNAEVICYPSTAKFLNAPPSDFPQTKLIKIKSFKQLETDYGLIFPESEGYEPLIQDFHIYSRDLKESAITSCQSQVPRIIEFKNPVTTFGMFAENFGVVGKKADAKFDITFIDDTTSSCYFQDPDPTHPERNNPIENKWFRFFGASSDKPIKKVIFSNVTDPRNGFRVWGLRIRK
jgi:hypothetical protein